MRSRESHGCIRNLKETDSHWERRKKPPADRHGGPRERFLVGRVVRKVQRSPGHELARDPASRDVVRRSEGEAVPRVEGVEGKRADDEEVPYPRTRSRQEARERDREENAPHDEGEKDTPSAGPAGREAGDERSSREEGGGKRERGEGPPQKTRIVRDLRRNGRDAQTATPGCASG